MIKNNIFNAGLSAAVLLALELICRVVTAELSPIWVQQTNVPRITFAADVAVDPSGNIYVNGDTNGLIGQTHAGGYDSYLIKYDSNGNKIWAREFGGQQHEGTGGIAIDSVGNVITVGYTEGQLAGPYLGLEDSFVRKYDSAGNVLWTRQFGSSAFDAANGATTDAAGNIFVTGYVHGSQGFLPPKGDVFLRKYDSTGTLVWESFLSSSENNYGYKVGADGLGNLFVCGYTNGQLGSAAFGGEDGFLAKFSSDGSTLWVRQFGSSGPDLAYDVAVDALGNSYVAGQLDGQEFLGKYDAAGNSVWTTQLNNPKDYSMAVSVSLDGLGGVYISGSLSTGQFVAEYSTDGALLQFTGALFDSYPPSVSADGLGSVYTFNSTWIGDDLAVALTKFAPIPEPMSASLFAIGYVFVMTLRRGR